MNYQIKTKMVYKLCTFLLALVLLFHYMFALTTQAYFNRGTVELSVGSNSAELTVGETYIISVSLSPESYTGYPGCGMAKCPEECDPSCLLDGMCQCAGTTLQTANTALLISIANTGIASANYSSGVLSITGVRPGNTTITVQGTLKEHTNSDPQVIQVNVTKKSSSGNTGQNNNDGGNSNDGMNSDSGTDDNSSVVIPNQGNTGNDQEDNSQKASSAQTISAEDDNMVSIMETDSNSSNQSEITQTESKESGETSASVSGEVITEAGGNTKQTLNTPKEGLVDIVTLNTLAPAGKEDLEAAKKRGTSVTFQKLDAAQKVEYSWTFQGNEILQPANFSMGITLSEEAQVLKSKAGKLKNPLFLSFTHDGELPGKAKVYISVGKRYQDGQKLYLYYFNQENKTLERMDEPVNVSGGYASFSLDHCSNYALTTEIYTENSNGISSWFIVFLVVLVIAATGFFYIKIRKRNKKKDGQDNNEINLGNP